MAVLLANNATTTLAAAINTTVTSISINSADAAKFPSPTGGDWFPITVIDSAGNMEIMKCTARSSATLTVSRAQEGTTAKSFAAGARVDLRLTAAAANELYKAGLAVANTWAASQTINGTLTVTGNQITIEGTNPRIYFKDTDAGADDFWAYANSDSFYILSDRADDGSWETPYPLQLRNGTSDGLLYGNKIVTEGVANGTVEASEFISSLINFNNGVLRAAGGTNYDEIWHSDSENAWYFTSDAPSTKYNGNTGSVVKAGRFESTPGSTEAFRAVAATGSDPYISMYQDTVRKAYLQYRDGTGDGDGAILFNDSSDDALIIKNTGDINALRFKDNSVGNYAKIWHENNLATPAQYSTTTSASTTSFPLGHTIACYTAGARKAANSAVVPCLSTNGTEWYRLQGTTSAGTALSGTWRARGHTSDEWVILERVA